MSLHHLNAMGIQTWRLKYQQLPTIMLVSDEPLTEAGLQLLHAMLAAVDIDHCDVLASSALKKQSGKVLILGSVAAQRLLNCEATIEELRGKVHSIHDMPAIVTHHPAFLLKHPKMKRESYADLCMIEHMSL